MKVMRIGTKEFNWETRTYVMGVINVTPDSFSGDGLLVEKDYVAAAVAQAEQFVAEGADMLDIGGESTRPGSTPVNEAEELKRVIPVVQALSQAVHIPLSIDTYKASVAREAVAVGANCINDVWGGRKDTDMYAAAAELNVPIILMHNSSGGQSVQSDARLGARFEGTTSKDVVAEVSGGLRSLASSAEDHGVSRENIILDPGFGFGKTVAQNLELVRRFAEFASIGYPLLAGVSRKSFVGYTLDVSPAERLEGTIAAAVLCAERGANIVRAHDVGAVHRALKLTDAVTRSAQK